MRDVIIRSTKESALNAQTYVKQYSKYSHLWTTDQKMYLAEYLKYGRPLTKDEKTQMEESEEFRVKELKPTLDMFRDQVGIFAASARN